MKSAYRACKQAILCHILCTPMLDQFEMCLFLHGLTLCSFIQSFSTYEVLYTKSCHFRVLFKLLQRNFTFRVLKDFIGVNRFVNGSAVPRGRWWCCTVSTSLVAPNLLALFSQFHGFCYFLFTDGSISQRCYCRVQTSVVVLKIVLQQMIMCCGLMISGDLHNENHEVENASEVI